MGDNELETSSPRAMSPQTTLEIRFRPSVDTSRASAPGNRSRSRSRSVSRSRSRSASVSISAIASASASSSTFSSIRQRSRSSTTGSFINFLSHDRGSVGRRHDDKLFSLYRLFMLELNIPSPTNNSNTNPNSDHGDHISNDAYEQISNLVKIPFVLEKFMGLGLLICLNAFLTLFTLVPIRIIVIGFITLKSTFKDQNPTMASISQRFSLARRDTLTIFLILVAVAILCLPTIDISKMYHDVRGQAQIKLYVMFGVLEVADKLCSSIGQNILSVLYDLVSCQFNKRNSMSFAMFFVASIFYLSLHSFILIYQAVSLNVAANSYSNALLTLLFSNQFSELRSSVFKKFDREGLFQLTMADLTERYQLSLMLGMIALRNTLQLSSIGQGTVPNGWQSWNNWVGALLGPSIGVLGSEILVDWLKHCYITKFNKIKPRIYNKFLYVLALDYLEVFKASSTHSNLEYELSDYIVLTKRIGLPLLATTVCFLRMSFADFMTIFTVSSTSKVYSFFGSLLLLSISFVVLLMIRLIIGLVLLKCTDYIKEQHEFISAQEFELQNSDVSNLVIPESAIFSDPETPINPAQARKSSKPETEDSPTPLSKETFPASPKSPIDRSFLPGIPNTEISSINPSTRSHLYDENEVVPPTGEEKRNKEFNDRYEENYDEGLANVLRYEMSSKRIW